MELTSHLVNQDVRSFKVLLVGGPATGKTSIVNRYLSDDFVQTYCETLGSDFAFKELEKDRESYAFQLWSCGGHERFRPLHQLLYADVDVIILVFDMTNQDTFKDLLFWHNEVLRALPSAFVLLVGNKCDLIDTLQITEEEAKAQAETWNVPLLISSAKTGYNVDRIFDSVISNATR
eukprot:GILJ01003210.1.p1 GENE.GILJ01003210.1~~GILJ01003210.1.p1  ORF type:complete len:177 (+),score=22.42 GILJ01003210.1:44-574(+)